MPRRFIGRKKELAALETDIDVVGLDMVRKEAAITPVTLAQMHSCTN